MTSKKQHKSSVMKDFKFMNEVQSFEKKERESFVSVIMKSAYREGSRKDKMRKFKRIYFFSSGFCLFAINFSVLFAKGRIVFKRKSTKKLCRCASSKASRKSSHSLTASSIKVKTGEGSNEKARISYLQNVAVNEKKIL